MAKRARTAEEDDSTGHKKAKIEQQNALQNSERANAQLRFEFQEVKAGLEQLHADTVLAAAQKEQELLARIRNLQQNNLFLTAIIRQEINKIANLKDANRVLVQRNEEQTRLIQNQQSVMESASQEWRSCSVCIEEFDDKSKSRFPVVLMCGHTLCVSCTDRIYNSSLVVCPSCRRATEVEQLDQLPINFQILSNL